ncbi:MAG: GNAT family protein [Chloroflexota bacterium]
MATATHTPATLVPLEDRHVYEAFALIDDNRAFLGEWMPWVADHTTVEDTLFMIQRGVAQFTRREGVLAGIWDDGKLAGLTQHVDVDYQNGNTRVTVWLGKAYQGRGLASRAMRSIMRYSFTQMNIERVEFRCTANNQRALTMAERLGFVREGTLFSALRVGERRRDVALYSMLLADWKERKTGPL